MCKISPTFYIGREVKCKAQKNKRQFFFHSSIMYYNWTKFITEVFHATDQSAMELLVVPRQKKTCNRGTNQEGL